MLNLTERGWSFLLFFSLAAQATVAFSNERCQSGKKPPSCRTEKASEDTPEEKQFERAGPPRAPLFHNLRFQEDWSWLREETDRDAYHSLKFIPLSQDGRHYLSLGGELRGRSEFWSGFGFGSRRPDADTFGLLRTRLHGDLQLGGPVRVFVEGKSALAAGRQLPGGFRTLDVDAVDVQNAFVDFHIPAGGDRRLTVRTGRQELQFGRQRLVSPLDWANTRPRIFDGFRASVRGSDWQADGFWTRQVRVRKYSFNTRDSGVDFYGLYAVAPSVLASSSLEFYWLGLDRTVGASSERRHTTGGRLGGRLGQSPWDIDVEGAYQFGSFSGGEGPTGIRAYMLAWQLGYNLAKNGRPRFTVGLDYASGDRDPTDRRQRTFDPLFPLGHAYLGYIDAVGRRNVFALSQGLSYSPVMRLKLDLDGHFFWLAKRGDALYDAGGQVLRAGDPSAPRRTGTEIDLTGSFRLDRRLTATSGYSRFFAGPFLKATGAARDANFGYLALQFLW
ncbi:MAG TPA: alginate export family protein [Acidobacteriota bacterium]|nr:alginate export family protein [Acidobacteriota bacterium]